MALKMDDLNLDEERPRSSTFYNGTNRNRLEILENAIYDIQMCKYDNLSYEQLHRDTYNLVLMKKSDDMYNMIYLKIEQHLIENVRADILKYLQNNFLQSFVKAWDAHVLCCELLNSIFLYFDANYIKLNKMDSIIVMGMHLFRNSIMHEKSIAEYLRENLLGMIYAERNGQVIDQVLIKTTIGIILELCEENQDLYKSLFEEPFILQSKFFYRNEALKYLQRNNCIEYVKQFEKRLDEENIRVAKYLHTITESAIRTTVEEIMFEERINTILSLNNGIADMLRNSLIDELKVVHKYCKKLSLLAELILLIVECMKIEGFAILHKSNVSKGIDIIENLIDLFIRYENVEKNVFENNEELKKLTIKHFGEIIIIDSNIAEYYALYFNSILNKNSKNNDGGIVEELLDRAMVVFRFLNNRDEFEYFYRKNLTNRLLLDKSVSEDNESYMISKFKVECGNQFSHKLEGMMKEMTVANTHQEMFDQYVTRNELTLNGLELSVKVLSVGLWPIKSPGPCNFQVDQNFAFETFKRYYLGLHEGRTLTLLPHLGNAFVTARFFITKERKACGKKKNVSQETYQLEMPSYQMAILMLFNRKEELGFNEIQQETEIEEQKLKNVLRSLILCKPQRILIKTPENVKIENTDRFCVNDAFSSKLRRIKIKTPMLKSDKESDDKEIRQKVDADRRLEIEAAIVRIMKTRKILAPSNLIVEIISAVKARFQPDPALIKKCIERLIEKEYIERLENSNYSYIA